MKKGSCHKIRTVVLLALSAILISAPELLFAQPVISPLNMPLGGGGVSYLTGFEANFINPANLMIRDRPGGLRIGLGSAGYQYDPVSVPSGISEPFNNFRSVIAIHKFGNQLIGDVERNEILERNYENSELISQHQNRYELLLGGVAWQGKNRTLSIAARTRMGIRTEVGRGWYDPTLIAENGRGIQNRNLRYQQMILHEISFGYAENFELISGLIPKLNQLYVGIAPKIVFSGSFIDLRSRTIIVQNDPASQLQLAREMELYTSDELSALVSQYVETGNAEASLRDNLSSAGSSFYTGSDNLGVGFDIGVTYVLELGRDIKLKNADNVKEPLKKSLRIGFSITDLGIVSFSENPLFLNNVADTTAVANLFDAADTKFIGAPGQFIDFFDRAAVNSNPFNDIDERRNDSFSSLLPTSFNGGVLFELNRIRLTADFTLGLNNTAFNSTKFTGHFGMEIRPHKHIPLRIGTRLADDVPTYLGLGTGYETEHWDFLLSTQLSTESGALFSELVGVTFGGLRFHF